MLCSICYGDDFYDDDQGGMSCSICGTQSQDHFAESHAVEDAGGQVFRVKGKLRSAASSRV